MELFVWQLMLYIWVSFGHATNTGNCRAIFFFVWPGIHRDGIVIQAISGKVHVSSCERVCRLRADCSGFNVNWTDAEDKIGLCTIITGTSYHWNQEGIGQSELAFYGKYWRL